MSELTLEKIEEVLEELFKDNPPTTFHPSVREEVNKLLKENLDKYYLMDYRTEQSFVNVTNLKNCLKTMATGNKNFEQMVESAQKAIDGPYYAQYTEWLQRLLDILKEGKYVTIQAKNGTFLDVSKIANTHVYASFFDVINQINRFDTTIKPKVTGKLKYKYFAFCIPQFF